MKKRIRIVENGITIDVEKLKRFIIDEWQSGKLIKWQQENNQTKEYIHDNVIWAVITEAELLLEETEEKVQKDLNQPNARLDWDNKYPKSDVRSIGFEVAYFFDGLGGSNPSEYISTADIPFILEFLDTPPDKTLEAWEKWEKYWDCIDYIVQQRKRLKNNN